MVLGQHFVKLDSKNRIAFPKKFRDVLGDRLIVTKGYENSLIVVAQDGWKTLLEGTEGKPFIHKEARNTQRFLLGNASYVELDEKGRFILPGFLKDFAKISEEVVAVGLSRYVELWDKKTWEEYQGYLEVTISSISERLLKKDETTG